jgi:BirA family transcriptional regulator, biotin operon repressor / biotin---[acetyl-CoA-carboxylase] ligase
MDTLFIGRNLIFLPETHSTNTYATTLLKNVNLVEGTLVHTNHQTKGRGQRGSSWNGEPGSNITASVLLNPFFLELKNHFFLYQITALACYDTTAELLANSQFDIKIKWPNDILVNKNKVAGILIENTILGNRMSWSVIGIGLNINQQLFDEDKKATSIKLLTKKTQEIDVVLSRLCFHLEKYYLQLKNKKFEEINDNYLSHFFGINSFMDFELFGEQKKLFVKGISEKGLLLLEDTDGSIIEMDVKQVKWIY